MARKSRKHLYDVCNPETPVKERVHYNAGGYVRLSSNDKRKRGDSIETQRNIVENYISTAPDINLVAIYSDKDNTGTNFERPGFQRMMADIEAGKINCVIVKDLTRFGRNAIDAGYYLERVLPLLGVRFVAITDDYDSLDGDGGLLIPLKNIIAETYALDISRKVRSVHKQNIADGRYVGRYAPYGYMKDPNDCHKLIIDKDTAPVVRHIFDLACSGVCCNDIARQLNNKCTISPNYYNYSKGYRKNKKLLGYGYWKVNTITKILSDRMYLGDMVQGKSRTTNGRGAAITPSEWICVPNMHEPIISNETFDKVQIIRQESIEQTKALLENATPYSPNIFGRKVLCANCGRIMRRHRDSKSGVYWFRCISQQVYSKDSCTVVSIKEADLLTELLVMLTKHSEVILGKSVSLEKIANSEKIASELREINISLDKDGRMLQSLYENLVDGLIEQSEFIQLKSDYEVEIAFLHQQANEIRNRQYEAKYQAEKLCDMNDAVSFILGNEALTSEIVDVLISKVSVQPDKSFDVLFNFRDEFSTSRFFVPEHLRLHGGNRRITNGGLEARNAS